MCIARPISLVLLITTNVLFGYYIATMICNQDVIGMEAIFVFTVFVLVNFINGWTLLLSGE